jgi:hypothetical protein
MSINPVGTCRICKRRHDNIGFQLSRSHPIKWYCRDCSSYLQVQVSKKQFDIYETASLQAGGEAAGAYLDTLGFTDLAELNPSTFLCFFAKFMGGYEDNMKKVFEELVE